MPGKQVVSLVIWASHSFSLKFGSRFRRTPNLYKDFIFPGFLTSRKQLTTDNDNHSNDATTLTRIFSAENHQQQILKPPSALTRSPRKKCVYIHHSVSQLASISFPISSTMWFLNLQRIGQVPGLCLSDFHKVIYNPPQDKSLKILHIYWKPVKFLEKKITW